MKKYKTLLFDFDDTLFDFPKSEEIALINTFEKYNIEKTEANFELYRKENRNFWIGFENGKYKDSSAAPIRFKNLLEILEICGIDYFEMNETYLTELSKTAFPIEDSVGMIKRLSEHYDIFIITNALARVNKARTQISGIKPYIKGTFISEEIGVSKPSKEYFDYCLKHTGGNKNSCLVIGDSLSSDIKGGINSGIDTCWFNRKNLENKENLKINYEVKSIKELETLLGDAK